MCENATCMSGALVALVTFTLLSVFYMYGDCKGFAIMLVLRRVTQTASAAPQAVTIWSQESPSKGGISATGHVLQNAFLVMLPGRSDAQVTRGGRFLSCLSLQQLQRSKECDIGRVAPRCRHRAYPRASTPRPAPDFKPGALALIKRANGRLG